MIDHYDIDGNLITQHEWGELFSDKTYARIALTDLGDDVHVSTVWLGIDHGFGAGPPLIFETMIFGGPRNEDTERYTTKEQALAGHNRIVAELARSTRGGRRS